jgi:hypothetical protein
MDLPTITNIELLNIGRLGDLMEYYGILLKTYEDI